MATSLDVQPAEISAKMMQAVTVDNVFLAIAFYQRGIVSHWLSVPPGGL
jgi:hypothetical protein